MNEEKMKILKMLEDGRISSEDAARLLESLGGSASSRTDGNRNTGAPKSEAFWGGKTGYPEGENNRQSRSTTSASKFDDFTSDISKKFEVLARDMEPKLQKLTEVVAEKTANAADRLSKSLARDSVSRETPPSYPMPDRGPSRTDSEKLHEIIVTPGHNELNITGLNGNVTVKGYNGDKITAKIYAVPKNAGYSKGAGSVELMKMGSKYVLHYNEDSFERISVDAYVPEALFQNIHIETNNGTLEVVALKGDYVNISNSNGNTKVGNVTAENIMIDCNNGRLDISDISAKNGQIENFNGDVGVTDIDISNLKLAGLNGGMTILLRFFNRYADYMWSVETSNDRLMANFPSGAEYGYYIKAHTTLSEVKIGMTGLNYSANSPSYVEAQTFHFNDSPKKMRISLETSNGPLTIN